MTALVASLLLVACGSSAAEENPGSTAPAPVSERSDDLVITRDVAIADVTTADVFAPRDADGVPVVVMFHGSDGRRCSTSQEHAPP